MKISKRANVNRYYLLKFFGLGVFLHKIHHSDPEVFHSHPWSWFSIIFGSYWENRVFGRWRKRTLFNFCKYGHCHRVVIDKPVWTLFFHGRRQGTWIVTDKTGEILETNPWRGVDNQDRVDYV